MSTTTQDVLLSDRIDELIRGGRSAGMITMMTWAGKALELEAERTKLLDLLQQGVDALTRQRDAIAAVNFYRKNKNNPHADKMLNSDIQLMWRELQNSNNAAAILLSKITPKP